jgi:hypothetical protein
VHLLSDVKVHAALVRLLVLGRVPVPLNGTLAGCAALVPERAWDGDIEVDC